MSSIFEGFLSTPEVMEALSDRSFVQAMLRYEAALARAQASAGLIPQALAQSIIGTCKVDLFDVPKIVRESARAGCLATPLIKSLKETVGLFNPEAAAFVHFGASSQDLIDSALAMLTGPVIKLIEADLDQAIAALLALAVRHGADPMLARTGLQPASVTSLGLKCVQWAAPLVRSRQRLRTDASLALALQLESLTGTRSLLNHSDPQIMALMAAELNLAPAPFAWHTQRDEWVALACELGLLVGSLGKIAKDIALMRQFEVAEVLVGLDPLHAASLTAGLPPPGSIECAVTLAAAQRVPQRVAALLAAMPQEHEGGLGNWQAELAEWPALMLSAHGAAHAMAQVLSSLQVDLPRMRANLDALRATLPAKQAAQWFGPDLVQHAATLTHSQLDALVLLRQATPSS